MCGLIGIAGDTTGSWKDVFIELLLIDSVRGAHSTGAGFVHRSSLDFKLAKEPGHPYNLFHNDDFDKYVGVSNPSKVIMGHNRFATIGEHTIANAHPFAFKHVMGMHNGTLDKFAIRDLHNSADYGTDSEAIFATINEIGIKKTMEVMTGAWALVWFDKRDDTINFLRNDRRPLYYCYSEDRCTLIWASEKEMLSYVLDRKNKKREGDEIFIVTKDMHYKWKVPIGCNTKFDSPVQTPREGKSYIYAHTPFTGTPKSYGDVVTVHTTGTTSTRTFAGIKKNDNILPFAQKFNPKKFRPPYKDLYGKVINKMQFEEMVAEGCAFCNKDNLKWGDFAQIMGTWCGPKATPFMCSLCYDDVDVYDALAYAV